MMTSQEINDYLTSFNINSYNRAQIGNSKQLIITIYEFLNKLNLKKDNIDIIISEIAYLNKDKTNIALYLELLSKSLGFAHTYDLKEVLRTIKSIHDLYFSSSALIPLEEYIHDTSDERIRKLFLNRNSKYLLKSFESNEALIAISDLKLASAITLESKEYKEFLSYIDEFEKFQDYYSPLLVFKTYNKVRKNLKVSKRLFWDILFGNEYVVALTKHNMPTKDIFKKNIYSNYKKKKKSSKGISIQLDLFSYLADEEDKILTKSKEILYETTEDLHYKFIGLNNNTTYKVYATCVTTNGLELETNKKIIRIQCDSPSYGGECYVETNNNAGYVKCSTYFVIIQYNGEKTFEFKDSLINLKNTNMYYDEGFEISGDFKLCLKAKGTPTGHKLLMLGSRDGEITLDFNYYEDETVEGYKFRLMASYGELKSINYSSAIQMSDDKFYEFWIIRKNHLYDIEVKEITE